jgi:hypothetical protein
MPLTADEMIAALEAFEPDSGYDDNQFRLYPITEGFKTLEGRHRVITAMFGLMERYPNAYLGTPGPLVHSIESLGIENYEPLLIESVRRQPTELTVWMVNRILNTELSPEHRRSLLELLAAVPDHPRLATHVADNALRFLKHQKSRGTI